MYNLSSIPASFESSSNVAAESLASYNTGTIKKKKISL